MAGYNSRFISGIDLLLPELTESQQKFRAPLINKPSEFELKYIHYSVVMHKTRKFAFYAATNIDGSKWNAIEEDRTKFIRDDAIAREHQVGDELYDFYKSKTNNDFDKGHIAKFQDPQWGDQELIREAAEQTMRFPNCVPQHHSLNRGAWKSLEDYVIKNFTVKNGEDGKKVTIFAGPVLQRSDPYYIHYVAGRALQIPCHFWKVIVYRNRENKLSAVGFIMSQKNILYKHNFVVMGRSNVRGFETIEPEADYFGDFTSGEPYQVRVDFIERVTNYQFGLDAVYHPYTKQESKEIIYKRVELPVSRDRSMITAARTDDRLDFELDGITL